MYDGGTEAGKAYPEICQAVLALHILHPEPDLPEGISLILQDTTRSVSQVPYAGCCWLLA